MRPFSLLLLAFLLAPACAVKPMPAGRPAAKVYPDLDLVFDCLRERNLALVSAHRGMRDPQAAENSLESFTRTVAKGPILIETDVRRTADGVLVLMHDDTIERTTTGRGPVAGLTYRQLREVWLTDGKGEPTQERIPTLDEALVWAKRQGAILQLDLKPGVTLDSVTEAVRHARMERQVILIRTNLADTRATLAGAPEMMVSGAGRNAAETAKLAAAPNPRLLIFTGIREPDPKLLARLDAAGIEAIAGTLGAPGERLDDRYLADEDGSEYALLAERGVQLIASDRPVEAWAALRKAKRAGAVCLLGEEA